MHPALIEANAISQDRINVLYRNGDAAALKARCAAWLERYEAECAAIRNERGTDRARNSALDLLDAAKWRVEGVYQVATAYAAKRVA